MIDENRSLPLSSQSDEDFLGYVEIHSQTERALYSGRDINRLLKLAGNPPGFVKSVDEKGFYSLHEPEARPLIDAAKRLLKRPKLVLIQGGKK